MAIVNGPDLAQLISSAVHAGLAQRDDLSEPGWSFWERRNLNMHRVVGLWNPGRLPDADELRNETRAAIGRHFRCAWWRGLGFGVVVELPDPLPAHESLEALVDRRENSKGTWQWIVLVSSDRRTASGIHTWAEGYLSPVYRALLAGLEAGGSAVTSVRVEKDGLMKILTAARPRLFPEFQNELPRRS